MRDFSWRVFAHTGQIEAYLLYKEMDNLGTPPAADGTEPGAEEEIVAEGGAELP